MKKRVWLSVCGFWLIVGMAAASLGYMPNDVGLGVLYFPILAVLTAPIGIATGCLYFVAMHWLESGLWGEGAHFHELAHVCLAWVAMVYPSYWFWFARKRP